MAAHGCTDIPFLIFLIAGVAGLVATLIYANENGDLNNISRGYNYEQQLCGVGELADYPFLFYCLEPPLGMTFDVKRPVCISECPSNSKDLVQRCATGPWVGYESKPVAGRTCMPTDPDMLAKVNANVKSGSLSQLPLKIAELPQAWLALLLSALIAFIVGYVYLHILEWFAFPLVWGCLLTCIAIPAAIGGCLIWISTAGNGHASIPETGLSNDQELGVGCGLCGLSALLLCAICCAHHGIDKAIECVKVACEAMFAQNSMLLAPAIEVVTKLVLIFPLLAGFLQLASCGELQFPESGTGYGILRTFNYTPEQWGLLIFYVFMMIWLMEWITSVSQFVVAYAVQAWFFTPIDSSTKVKKNAPHFGIFTGYILAGTVHLGTMAMGSCLIANCRLLRIVMGLLFDKNDTSNPIAECLGTICCCFAECFEHWLKILNKSAYIEVAINGTAFCASAREAVKIMSSDSAMVALNGATFILQFGGIGAIAGGGAALTWCMCIYVPTFSDASSEQHVEDPVFITGVATIICGVIAVAFMNVFDTAADTLLFCIGTEKKISASEDAKKPLVVEEPKGVFAFLSCAAKPPKPTEKLTYSTGKLRELVAVHR